MKLAGMNFLNIVLTGLFVVFGLPSLVLSIYIALTTPTLYVSMHDGLHQQMQTSKEYVRAFRQMHGRAPSQEDYSYWSKADYRVKGAGIDYQTSAFPDELMREFGPAPEGAYVLSFWTGNNRAACPSWAKNDRVGYVSEKDFWVTGGRWTDFAMPTVWWLVLLMLARISNVKLRRQKEENKLALLRA